MKFWKIVTYAAVMAFFLSSNLEAADRKKTRHQKIKSQQVAKKSKKRSQKPKSGMGTFESRFARGTTQWGVNVGYGYTFDLPSPSIGFPDRTNMDFLFLFPHFKYNLTGVIGDSFYRGALYWVAEAGLALSLSDSDRVFFGGTRNVTASAPQVQVGFVPVQAEYKFLGPTRRWAPTVLLGAGFTYGDFDDGAVEISTDFEFVLNAGLGVEYFLEDNKSVSLGYRLWHLSNSGIKKPNIGLNAHLFTVGFSF